MSLRTRVALICASLTAVVSAGFGVVVFRVVESELVEEVDETLDDRSTAFVPAVVELVGRDGALAGGLEPVVGGSPVRGLVDGQVVFDVGPSPAVAPRPAEPDRPAPGAGDRVVEIDTVEADGASWRRATVTVWFEDPSSADGSVADRSGPPALVVELFEPLGPLRARLDQIGRRVAGAALLSVVVAGTLGYLAGRRATRAVGRLVAQARSIEGSGSPIAGPGAVADPGRGGDGDGRPFRIDAGDSGTEVAELQTALNEMLDRLDRSQARTVAALASSRAFAADASHELRTPLAAIAANLEILRRHPDLDPGERDQILSELAERQEWMGRLLTSLRDLARVELSDPDHGEVVDVGEVVDEVLAAMVGSSRQAVPGERAGDLTVRAAPDLLRILVVNLVRNAQVHGRGADGTVDLRVSVRTGPGPPGRGDGVGIRVDDAGPGIPEADRWRVRQRFERGGSGSDGTGLGLALVDQVVRLHDGDLRIGEADGGGCRVDVWLPRAPGDEPRDVAGDRAGDLREGTRSPQSSHREGGETTQAQPDRVVPGGS